MKTTTNSKASIIRRLQIAALVFCLAVIAGCTSFMVYASDETVKYNHQLSLGQKYLEELNYDKAIVHFDKAISIDPKAEPAYQALAETYFELEDYDKALEVLETGIKKTNSTNLESYQTKVQKKWDEKNAKVIATVYETDADLDDSNDIALSAISVAVTYPDGETVTIETGADGSFETEPRGAGEYTFQISGEGYWPVEYKENITETTELSLFLEWGEPSVIGGLVTMADDDLDYTNNEWLEGADVCVQKLNGACGYLETVTDEMGLYEIYDLSVGVYEISVKKEGFVTYTQRITIFDGLYYYDCPMIELILEEYAGNGTVSGTIYDAVTGDGVSDITLEFREGSDNLDGEVISTIQTGDYGWYQSEELPTGNYCVSVVDNRGLVEDDTYMSSYMNIKVLGNRDVPNQDGVISKEVIDGQLRIVLTWGDNPNDLDSHLITPYGDEVFYGSQESYYDNTLVAALDLDDTDSFGPETTTIYDAVGGVYTFYVYDYSNGNISDELAYSGASVKVYSGNRMASAYTFSVPQGEGGYWTVFEYDSNSGTIIPINKVDGDIVSSESLYNESSAGTSIGTSTTSGTGRISTGRTSTGNTTGSTSIGSTSGSRTSTGTTFGSRTSTGIATSSSTSTGSAFGNGASGSTASAAAEQGWEELYRDAIDDWYDEYSGDSYFGYELIYLDDNDIPELCMYCDDQAYFAFDIYTIVGGEAKKLYMYEGSTHTRDGEQGQNDFYFERSGISVHGGSAMGWSFLSGYKLVNGNWEGVLDFSVSNGSGDSGEGYYVSYKKSDGSTVEGEGSEYAYLDSVDELPDIEENFGIDFDNKSSFLANRVGYEEILEELGL